MASEILMPALSPTMEEGKLAKWLVKEGDEVRSGDILAEIETDKATMEFEAVDEGRIGKILVPEGTEGVKVNQPIATLLADGEDASAAVAHKTPPSPTRAESQGPARTEEGASATPPSRPAASDARSRGGKEKESVVAEVSAEPEVPEGTEFVTMTVREALRDAMAEEMRRDPDVFLMGEEVAQYQGAYKVSQGLLEEFGERRVIDTPITEHGFTGLGVGAGFAGLKPVVEFMTFNFAMQAIDQIINSAAKTRYMSGGQMHCPIVFRGPNGPASRVGAQHSQDYSSWYAHVPGVKVIAPYFAADAKGLLKAAIRDPNPVIFLENEIVYGRTFPVPKLDDFVLPIGKARVVKQGRDVTLVAHSICVGQILEAAEALAKEGIDAELIDLRTLRPLDTATVIESVKKTNRLVTVEQGWPICSIGSEVAAQVVAEAFDYLDAPPTKVTGKDVPMPYAANLEKLALPTVEDIVAAVKAVCYRS
ncbi:MAG: pyruvate dehydrogenase complex E1 component subunit beta [Alphaproteobacteria bacterium]|nr:pyruvate dehydrogenase complex E1 component subunit beta [Alphaproteobacteria bacterium]MDE2014643.1 pyruvate dehydrogenase complex E1 component subunit beta [Alphaproteobacteria bacterium]MDE2073894.1 pyruvate dehydrogenase complex E1 component subunit beta [Alphaproteobacteria bacterium]